MNNKIEWALSRLGTRVSLVSIRVLIVVVLCDAVLTGSIVAILLRVVQ